MNYNKKGIEAEKTAVLGDIAWPNISRSKSF